MDAIFASVRKSRTDVRLSRDIERSVRSPVVPLVEALDTSSGIDKLLRTREERMARRADLNVKVLRRGLRLYHIAA